MTHVGSDVVWGKPLRRAASLRPSGPSVCPGGLAGDDSFRGENPYGESTRHDGGTTRPDHPGDQAMSLALARITAVLACAPLAVVAAAAPSIPLCR